MHVTLTVLLMMGFGKHVQFTVRFYLILVLGFLALGSLRSISVKKNQTQKPEHDSSWVSGEGPGVSDHCIVWLITKE